MEQATIVSETSVRSLSDTFGVDTKIKHVQATLNRELQQLVNEYMKEACERTLTGSSILAAAPPTIVSGLHVMRKK